MEKEDRELIKLLNDSKKGNKNSFEKFTRLVYQEVYNLVAFVYITKESREKLTKHVLVRMFKNASEFDNEELDIHLWIARFTTVEVYNVCKKQNGELFDTQISAEEYNYDSISEDSEFAKCAADYNQAFLDIDQLNEIMTDFEDFSKGQRLLYLMFAYESYTIDEIEDLLEIDSTFIGTQIMQIRGMLGLDMVSLDGDGPQVHVADEDSSEDETDDEDSSDDSVPEIDFDDNDNYSDRYDAKSANHGIKADARMRGIIAICAALVVVLAVATVAIAGRIKKNKSKSTFNPTPVTTAAEEATTKKVEKAAADADGYQVFKMPWSLSLSYSFNISEDRSKPINRHSMRYPYTYTHNINANGNVKISNNWSLSFNSGYDFQAKEITQTSCTITRDLHCFNLSASLSPFGRWKYYNVTIRANASILQDLKYEQRSQTQSNIQWY